VVFLNILKLENQALMKYNGVAAIPTQVLLKKDGKAFYRHSGYFPNNQSEKGLVQDLTISLY
jgi:thioredoxin-related protein